MIEPRRMNRERCASPTGSARSVAPALGIAGVFLPVPPTTPFVLVAAFCYSEALGEAACEAARPPAVRPLIRAAREPHRFRRVPSSRGWTLMAVSFSWSIYVLRDRPWLQASLLLLGVVPPPLARIPDIAARCRPAAARGRAGAARLRCSARPAEDLGETCAVGIDQLGDGGEVGRAGRGWTTSVAGRHAAAVSGGRPSDIARRAPRPPRLAAST